MNYECWVEIGRNTGLFCNTPATKAIVYYDADKLHSQACEHHAHTIFERAGFVCIPLDWWLRTHPDKPMRVGATYGRRDILPAIAIPTFKLSTRCGQKRR
jgi:hypothetical protein